MQDKIYQLNQVNGDNMADKLGLGTEVRELKLGPSFTSKSTSFHSLRYDFKPASVVSKVATVDVGANHQVTVTVPHPDGAGTPLTVFKGSQRPCQKECVLIIDRVTGEITLEKLSSNIQVKKTRMESSQKLAPPVPVPPQTSYSVTPIESNSLNVKKPPSPQHRPNKYKKSSSKLTSLQIASSLSGSIPKHSPLHASPSYPTSRSPTRPLQHKSPPGLNSHAASLPMIGLDDGMDLSFEAPPPPLQVEMPASRTSPDYSRTFEEEETGENLVGILSDSSSDSSSDSGSSDSDSEPDTRPSTNTSNDVNGDANGTDSPSMSMPDHLLSEDLQLSESGSDSD